jgi:plasmid stabilization system protein ParE
LKAIRYTLKARTSIQQIAEYLLEQTTSKAFVKQHLEKLRKSIEELLTSFPDAGVQIQLQGMECRRLVVQGYSVLYVVKDCEVAILLIYKQNEPKLN